METAPIVAAEPPWYRIPAPDTPVAGWHVSPFVDAAAYHWSWVWVLLPVLRLNKKTSGFVPLSSVTPATTLLAWLSYITQLPSALIAAEVA